MRTEILLSAATFQLRQALAEWRISDTTFRDDRGYQLCRCDVECGIENRYAFGRYLRPRELTDLARRALFDRYLCAARALEIDRR